MINFSTIIAIARRHILVIIGAAVLCAGASVALDMTKPKEASPARYMAQTSIHYVIDSIPRNQRSDGSESDFIGRGTFYNVSRLVESSEVAGEVRRQFGDDTTVQVAYYRNPNGSLVETDFLTLSVRAESAQTAVDAAQLAAELSCKQIEKFLRVEDVTISSEPILVNNVDPSKVVDFGITNLKPQAPSVVSGLNKRRLFIFVFLGLFGSFMLCAARDLLSRRLYDRHDVQRLINAPVLACVSSARKESYTMAAHMLQAVLKKEQVSSMYLASLVSKENPQELKAILEECSEGKLALTSSGSLDDASALADMQQAESVVLIVRKACASGAELEQALCRLEFIGVPLAGCIFVEK